MTEHSKIRVLAGKLLALSRGDETERWRTAVAVACLFMLRKQKLAPLWLSDDSRCPHWFKQFERDSTSFAGRLTRLVEPALSLTAGCGELESIYVEADAEGLLEDPLLIGWLYQCFLSGKRTNVFDLKDKTVDQVRGAEVDHLHVPKLTQWFTPQWISTFLVERTLQAAQFDAGETFIDPACGTGNILIEFIKQRMQIESQKSQASPLVALNAILQNELYGLDIDPFVVVIAGFSIYLFCRQVAPIAELPLPMIFSFQANEKTAQAGSLLLGLKEDQQIQIEQFGNIVELNILPKEFKAVVTNPPYLGQRLIPSQIAVFLKENYLHCHFDLYSAFIKLAMNITKSNGAFGLICQQTFMSIARYKELRKELLDRCSIDSLVQLGAGAFASRTGEKVNNAIIVAAKNNKSTQEVACRRISFQSEQMQARLSGINSLPVICYKQSDFLKCPGQQFAFWCPLQLISLFERHKPLKHADNGFVLTNGLFTCNNKKFVKLVSDVSESERHKFVSYDKGGGQKWYHKTPYALEWGEDGQQIRQFRLSRGQSYALPGERYYFQPGITYSYIGTKGFRARLLSPQSVFDIASSAIFSSSESLEYLLGFLNSSLVCFLLGVLNPTINFQIGDLGRLPYKTPDEKTRSLVIDAAKRAILLTKEMEENRLANKETQRDYEEAEWQCQQIIDQAIFDLYEIDAKTQQIINEDTWVVRSRKPRNLSSSRTMTVGALLHRGA